MTNGPRARGVAGFTLLEVMITVAIVGILASIALPSYSYFITRSRITEATNALSDMRAQQEKWFMDHRDYTDGAGKCGIEATPPDLITKFNANTANKFVIYCPAVTTSTYTLRAAARRAAPWRASSTRSTSKAPRQQAAVPTGWTGPARTPAGCLRKEGSCS